MITVSVVAATNVTRCSTTVPKTTIDPGVNPVPVRVMRNAGDLLTAVLGLRLVNVGVAGGLAYCWATAKTASIVALSPSKEGGKSPFFWFQAYLNAAFCIPALACSAAFKGLAKDVAGSTCR